MTLFAVAVLAPDVPEPPVPEEPDAVPPRDALALVADRLLRVVLVVVPAELVAETLVDEVPVDAVAPLVALVLMLSMVAPRPGEPAEPEPLDDPPPDDPLPDDEPPLPADCAPIVGVLVRVAPAVTDAAGFDAAGEGAGVSINFGKVTAPEPTCPPPSEPGSLWAPVAVCADAGGTTASKSTATRARIAFMSRQHGG